MEAAIEYLLRCTALWALGLGWYAWQLRRRPLLWGNRLYLLLCLLLVPLVVAGVEWWLAETRLYFYNPAGAVVAATAEAIAEPLAASWGFWSLVLLCGALLGLLRLGFGLWFLWRLRLRSERRDLGGCVLLRPRGTADCYAFFGYVVIGDQIEESDFPYILAHERAHNALGHSWDNLLLELLTACFWFHPLLYVFRFFLREVHEYQADAKVVSLHSAPRYGELLVQRALNTRLNLLHHFSHSSQLKNRLAMINRLKDFRTATLAYWISLPALFIAFFLFSQRVAAQNEILTNPEMAPIYGQCEGDESAQAACSQLNIMKFLAQNMTYPKSAKDASVQGKVFVQFTINKSGELVDAEVKKSLNAECDAEALRVVRLLKGWKPGTQGGKPVDTRLVLPIMFKLQ